MPHYTIFFLICLFSQGLYAADKIPVTVSPLGELLAVRTFDAPADVLQLSRSQISAEITATVLQTRVRAGDSVKAGDVLAELDCEAFELQRNVHKAALTRASAQLPYVREQLKRARELDAKKSISDELLDQRIKELAVAQADYQQAEQQLKLAERDVRHCDVITPFDGVVLQRHVSQGTLVSPGTRLFDIMEKDRVEIKARVRRDQLASLQRAEKIWFDNAGQPLSLKLRSVIPLVERASLTLEVRLELLKPEQAIAGDTGRLYWQAGDRYLPASLLLERGGQFGLFIAAQGKAEFHAINDAVEGQPFAVDLPAEALVIMEGRYRLQQGDSVELGELSPAD